MAVSSKDIRILVEICKLQKKAALDVFNGYMSKVSLKNFIGTLKTLDFRVVLA